MSALCLLWIMTAKGMPSSPSQAVITATDLNQEGALLLQCMGVEVGVTHHHQEELMDREDHILLHAEVQYHEVTPLRGVVMLVVDPWVCEALLQALATMIEAWAL